MSSFKRRAWPVALVTLYLLSGLSGTASLTGTQTAALAATTPPDLMIESLAITPEAPSIGDTLTFTITIRNCGDTPAAPSLLTCTIDESQLAEIPVAEVPPGATLIKTSTWKAQAGPHIFQAVIDSDDSVAESDEDNNTNSFAFSVAAPDLFIEAISWTPVSPAAGDEVTFTVTVANQGDRRAGVSHLDFFIDSISRGYRLLLGIDAGASVNATFVWKALEGSHKIGVAADVLHQVTESDETNNASEATFATALPDLILQSLTISPQYPSEGDSVTLTVTVKNQDIGRAGPSSLFFYVDDVLQDLTVIGYLSYNDNVTATFNWIAGSSPHAFKFLADATDVIEESDETNNILTSPTPMLLPDLIVQDITWTPANPVLYGPVISTITVKNQGTCQSDTALLKFGVDTIHQYTSMIPALSVNATTTIKFMWFTSYTSHSLKASIDDDDTIKESNESNNTLTKTISSIARAPSPDLVPEDVTISPARPVIGESVTISLRVKNQGPGHAGASYAAIYFDNDLMDSVFIDGLDSGATVTKDVTLPLEGLKFQDTYAVKVVVDSDDRISEVDESNNEIEASFSMSAPDLIIQAVTWSPEAPSGVDSVTFDVTVKNRGDLKAGSTYISYYVEGSFQGRHSIEDIEAGGTATRYFTWATSTADFTFTAVVDEDGEINESDESNNTRTVVFPAPDLFIEAITWSPDSPVESSPVSFQAIIGNRGRGLAGHTLLSYTIDDAAPATVDTGEIAPGGTATIIFSDAFASGQHAIKFTADGQDAITESDETNNEITIDISLLPLSEGSPPPTPESSESSATAPGSAVTADVSNNLSSQNASATETPETDVSSNISCSPPGWQGILLNRWLIIGIAVLGIGAVGGLLLFRKKAGKL